MVQIICKAFLAAQTLEAASYVVLDRFFLSVPALTALQELNASGGHYLDIITRAKKNVIAYELPEEKERKGRGRPALKGKKVCLWQLFPEKADEFVSAQVMMYGKREDVKYYCTDLLWGKGLYKKLRFVLVSSSMGYSIFVSTDTFLHPLLIIKAYSHPFKIEQCFKVLKLDVGGLFYHFWTKFQPKLKRYRKKGEQSELSQVKEEKAQAHILDTVQAMDRFVFCSCVALGLAQMIALNQNFIDEIQGKRYLRTTSKEKVSEASVLTYLRKNIFRMMYCDLNSKISKLILKLQWKEEE